MIEETVRDELERALEVKVFTDLPENLPGTFMHLDKTGDSQRNFLNTATFAVRSYGVSSIEAARLSEKVKDAMRDLAERDEIVSVKLNSESDYPDTVRKRPRYQAAFDIVYYEE